MKFLGSLRDAQSMIAEGRDAMAQFETLCGTLRGVRGMGDSGTIPAYVNPDTGVITPNTVPYFDPSTGLSIDMTNPLNQISLAVSTGDGSGSPYSSSLPSAPGILSLFSPSPTSVTPSSIGAQVEPLPSLASDAATSIESGAESLTNGLSSIGNIAIAVAIGFALLELNRSQT